MAQFIPENFRFSTKGEALLANALKDLPDEYIVYHEPHIKNRRPDFVIIGPDLGFVVLEVKDYIKSTLLAANKDEWVLQINGNIVKHQSPLSQARKYAQDLNNILKKDSQLTVHEGSYKGYLRFPYGYGVVFTRLTQRDLVESQLYNVIPPELCLTRDEVDPDNEFFSQDHLLNKIRNMFTIRFPNQQSLTDDDIKTIRYYLFPEVRISAQQVKEEQPIYEEQILFSLRDVKVMDLHQENLAKGIGDKHRLLRGVAGSGKTLVLACRAKYLAQLNPNWRILILCYNISLANFIRQMIDEIDLETKNVIDVDNFHNWCSKTWALKDDAFIEDLLIQINNGDAQCPRYDAILIDEGQDFEPSWLRLAFSALNPETSSFLLVEDRAQQIYYRNSLSQELGISCKGRSKILTINYRNTEEIINFAWDFYQNFSTAKSSHKDDIVEIIPPKSAHRHGPTPIIKRFPKFTTEANSIAKEIKRLHEQEDINYSDMAILYRVKKFNVDYVDILKKALKSKNIEFYWLSESNATKRSFHKKDQGVKLSTVESAKGLEFKIVFICNMENFPLVIQKELQREVALVYIAMTRAVERLYLTYSGESIFTKYLDNLSSTATNSVI